MTAGSSNQSDADAETRTGTPSDPVPSPFPSSSTDDDPLAPGTRVGPFLVLSRLTGGGMSHVFLAEDTRLHRRVVLKRLLPTPHGTAAEHARLLREARAAAQVSSPHVAVVHDVLEHRGRAVIVMEFVEGESLQAVMRRGRLPLERLISIGCQLAIALEAAHARGIVHRDLKPANVQITASGNAKVLDFGIAAVTATFAAATERSAAVGVGAQAGTPGYMAPEQRDGHDVDARSDIYALGVLLFEMATGERAFPRDVFGTAAASWPALRRADRVNPACPARFADVITRAAADDPAKRYQSAADLRRDLESLVARPSVPVRLLRLASAGLGAAGAVWFLGFFINVVFNLTSGREGDFGRESLRGTFGLGLQSLVAPAFHLSLMLAATWVVRFFWRVLPLPAGLRLRARSVGARLTTTLDLGMPRGFVQAVVVVATLSLAVLLWQFRDLLAAIMTSINTAPAEQLQPLAYRTRYAPAVYRIALVALGFGLVLAILRTRRLARPAGVGSSVVIPLYLALAMVVLLAEAPYRLFWNNAFERVAFGGERCYAIGRHVGSDPAMANARLLLFCPDRPPPRLEPIAASDPRASPTGHVESIFTPPDMKGAP